MWYNHSASSHMLPLHDCSAIMRNVDTDCIKIAFYNCQLHVGLGNSFHTHCNNHITYIVLNNRYYNYYNNYGVEKYYMYNT